MALGNDDFGRTSTFCVQKQPVRAIVRKNPMINIK